MYIKANGVQ